MRLGGGGGAEVGIGGRASAQRTGPAIGYVDTGKGPRLAAETGQCGRVGLGTCLPGHSACSGPLHPVVLPKFFTELALGPAGNPFKTSTTSQTRAQAPPAAAAETKRLKPPERRAS